MALPPIEISVFPAQAGVFPSSGAFLPVRRSLPRASGGVSWSGPSPLEKGTSSPRKRGCFLEFAYQTSWICVFPAQAGVFPLPVRFCLFSNGLPRASGGVSNEDSPTPEGVPSSPRKRGCFHVTEAVWMNAQVFPAQAGVFQAHTIEIYRFDRSSPRKRGCFHNREVTMDGGKVFPAQAGVFPKTIVRHPKTKGLPRASGGVSSGRTRSCRNEKSSPRKRGCFPPPKPRKRT